MKLNTFLFSIIFLGLISVALISCGDDEEASTFDYAISIESPNTDAKTQGDMMPIKVTFTSATENTIHNVNVKIYNADDNTIIAYDKPDDMHVHEESGVYVLEDMLMLSHTNGFHTHGDWILEATVSGHNEEEKVTESITFHVHPGETEFAYHAHIHSPNTDDKKVGDELSIDVEFESHSGETVHHVEVMIYDKDNPDNIIYKKPEEAHVHATEAEYIYKDVIMLNGDNGVEGHTDWVLQARVWGPAGAGEVIESVEFHVHPE